MTLWEHIIAGSEHLLSKKQHGGFLVLSHFFVNVDIQQQNTATSKATDRRKMHHPSRAGVRGGKDQFEWESVKTDKHRENYLGTEL
jgi:hypothetical protein